MSEILRIKQVTALTKMSRSTIYDQIKAGTFPRPMKLGAQAVGWTADQINQWIEERLARSRVAGGAK